MRGKVVTPIFGVAFLIILGAGIWHASQIAGMQEPPSANFVNAPTELTAAQQGISPAPERRAASTTAMLSSIPDDATNLTDKPQPDETIDRVANLRALAVSGDPNALGKIAASLSDASPEIRQAALTATVELGDRSAIPALNEAMQSNPDPLEKSKIQQAIEYLQLPTLHEQDMQQMNLTSSQAQ